MFRRVEKKDHGKWVPIDFMKLTSGCTFRMYDEDDNVILDKRGHDEYVAAGKPYINPTGVPQIRVY